MGPEVLRFPTAVKMAVLESETFLTIPYFHRGRMHPNCAVFLMASGNPDLFLFVFPLQIFSQEYINLLLSMYFFVLGILALSHTIRSEGISHLKGISKATFEATFSGASTGSWMGT